jgi:hypothetical protein
MPLTLFINKYIQIYIYIYIYMYIYIPEKEKKKKIFEGLEGLGATTIVCPSVSRRKRFCLVFREITFSGLIPLRIYICICTFIQVLKNTLVVRGGLWGELVKEREKKKKKKGR